MNGKISRWQRNDSPNFAVDDEVWEDESNNLDDHTSFTEGTNDKENWKEDTC